ncbi:ABC transporter permease [Amycolatopsis sp. YIM 10]|uniref:ABC transporter permease n=1 Tax=Amycolatopsis sp. YIM 10 TaxID=2653857 RepID=UPI0012905D66|nr:ABC transporter permease [Amycolatopsis sp. YIM 10]QFU90580.1 Daunorubicin/doxorubicin resistance ABC transporter permease protein DrrB [Amycolatopsis sp. YIM 10]
MNGAVVPGTVALLRRNLREGVRSPVIAFIFPVLFPLFLITLVASSYERMAFIPGFPVRPYAAYMAPGLLLFTGMMGSGYSATALMLDAQTGFLDRLRLQPVRPLSILLSRLLFDAIRVIPAVAVVLVVSVVLGARIDHGWLGVLGLLVFCCVWSVAYGGLFYVVALRTGNPQAPLAMAPLSVLLLFASPAAAPPFLLQDWLETVSAWNPFTYVIEGLRALMTGPLEGSTDTALLRAGLVLLVLTVLTQLIVVPSFRRLVED